MCQHKWMTSKDPNGEPSFRMNRQMSLEPVVHATCSVCKCRTWLTREQWKSSIGDG